MASLKGMYQNILLQSFEVEMCDDATPSEKNLICAITEYLEGEDDSSLALERLKRIVNRADAVNKAMMNAMEEGLRT